MFSVGLSLRLQRRAALSAVVCACGAALPLQSLRHERALSYSAASVLAGSHETQGQLSSVCCGKIRSLQERFASRLAFCISRIDPDIALELRDESSTPTAKLYGAGWQKNQQLIPEMRSSATDTGDMFSKPLICRLLGTE